MNYNRDTFIEVREAILKAARVAREADDGVTEAVLDEVVYMLDKRVNMDMMKKEGFINDSTTTDETLPNHLRRD